MRNKEHVCPAAGEGNSALLEFLQSRNPKGQHSFSLESYLIKPIQRILKYPLLLQQLKHLTDPNSQEHLHLSGTSPIHQAPLHLYGQTRVTPRVILMLSSHSYFSHIWLNSSVYTSFILLATASCNYLLLYCYGY